MVRKDWAAAVSVMLASACGASKARDFLLSPLIQVRGTFTSPAGAPAALAGFVVDGTGTRTAIEGFSYDPGSGRYAFAVETAKVRTQESLTLLDQAVALEETPPVTSVIGRLTGATLGTLSFELGPPPGAEIAIGALPGYARVAATVPRAAALTAEKAVVVDVDAVVTAGAAKAKVVGPDGAPIPGAQVFAVALRVTETGTAKPLKPWTAGAFRSVASRTAADGFATVFPVPTEGAGFAFQLVAVAPGFCTQTTEPQSLTADTKPIEIKLAACAEASTRKSSPDLYVELDPSIVTRTENGQRIALMRENLPVLLDVHVKNLALSGIAVRVYVGDQVTPLPRSERIFDTVPPKLVVELPDALADGNPDGRFLITVSPTVNVETSPVRTIRGIRSSVKPKALATDFQVLGPAGAADVISGVEGKTFFLRYANCTGIESIGLHLGVTINVAANAKFQICDPSGNAFDPVEFGLQTLDGVRTATFFLTDEFGNVSEPQVEENLNQRDLFVDVAAPVITELTPSFGIDFGFAPAGDPPGTNSAPYVFRRNPGSLLRVTPTTVANFVLRFARPGACRTEPPAGTLLVEERDVTIGYFQIVRAGVSAFATCTEDLSVADGDLRFPTAADSPANFLLTVKDLAGNGSDPFLYQIPPCTDPAANAICWEN